MFIGNEGQRSIYSLAMRFSDGGAQPPADAVPMGDPAPEPAPVDSDIDGSVDKSTDIAAELEAIRESLEIERQSRLSAEKSRKMAEDALVQLKKDQKVKEREKMSVEDQLAERQKELDERESTLRRRMNETVAKSIFADLKLTDKELTEDDLGLFVSSNEERTTARCQWLKDFVKKREELAAKAEREKVLKEMPAPPAGEGGGNADLFVAGFNEG